MLFIFNAIHSIYRDVQHGFLVIILALMNILKIAGGLAVINIPILVSEVRKDTLLPDLFKPVALDPVTTEPALSISQHQAA